MIKMHNFITSFCLRKVQLAYTPIKGIKLHYLFSEKDHIQQFLSKTQISVRLTNSNNWNSTIAEGSSYGLYQESEKYSMRKFKQILLFNQKSSYSIIGIHIGLKLDGLVNAEGLVLNPIYDVYTAQNYTYCNALPAQWMQIIDSSYCMNKNYRQNLDYQLNLEQKDIIKMPPILPNNKKKLKL